MSHREQSLLSACYSGNLNEVKNLLTGGVDPNCIQSTSIYSEDYSALCIAALKGYLEVTKLLLEHGADVNYRCKHGESALFLAARKGHLKITECLLKADAKVAYTAKSGDNLFLENWEVFTQVLRDVYPKDINDFESSNHKAVVQLLIESSGNFQWSCSLYEVLYCSLTVFVNPIAVYCVGVYSQLSPDSQAAVFCEDSFLSALCHAFDFSRREDFINTVHSILTSNKLRQKEVCQSLLKHFNWGKLAQQFAEISLQNHVIESNTKSFSILKKFFAILNIFVNVLTLRAEVQQQFLSLSNDNTSKVGRMFKSLIGLRQDLTNACPEARQFLFFLLKQFLRDGQKSHASRLLLRSPAVEKDNSRRLASAEFEKAILLKSVEEDIALSHMLIDFGVSVCGECFVNFVKQGHVDLVDRCANDRELLFSKEVCQLLQTPASVRSSSNRNVRRCIKVIKNQRNAIEKIRSEMEKELLTDTKPSKTSKKKQRQRSKRQEESRANDKHLSNVNVSDKESDGNLTDIVVGSLEEKNCSAQCSSSDEKVKSNRSDEAGPTEKKPSSKRKKNKTKSKPKVKAAASEDHSEESSEEKNDNLLPDALGSSPPDDGWKELVLSASRRRRRQSSSSSECSTGCGAGPRKNVHFSHPIAFYENTKATTKSRLRRLPSDVAPKASNLRTTKAPENSFDLAETYRTNATDNSEFCDIDFDAIIPWRDVSKRWCARFEDLSESDLESVKEFVLNDSDCGSKVYFSESQYHYRIGSGPDFSTILLGLTNKGREVCMKRITKKRVPILSDQKEVDKLLGLGCHPAVNKYHAVFRERMHFYVLQDTAEYSLDQIVRKKLISLPLSAAEAFQQLASGLDFLHRHDVLHMALKPSNVLLGADNKLRLTDYGIHARDNEDGKRNSMSPPLSCLCWMVTDTPAFKGRAIFTKESDIKTLGMVFFYVLTEGGHPYGNPDNLPGECVQNIAKDQYNLKRLGDPLSCDLIRSMIAKNTPKRIALKEIQSHPFFWSDEDKDAYFSLLIQAALSGGRTSQNENILDALESQCSSLSDGAFDKNRFEDVPDEAFSSFKDLLSFFLICMNDLASFQRHFKLSSLDDAQNPVRCLRSTFPNLVLYGSKTVTWDDLELALVQCDITPIQSVAGGLDLACGDLEDEDSLVFSILGLELNSDKKSYNEDAAEPMENSPDKASLDLCDGSVISNATGSSFVDVADLAISDDTGSSSGDASYVLVNDINIEKTTGSSFHCPASGASGETGGSLKEKEESIKTKVRKSPSLHLTPNLRRIVDDDSYDGDTDLSPSNLENCISPEWDPFSIQSSGTKPKLIQKPSQINSPDDWIEVGSPIDVTSTTTTSKPIRLREIRLKTSPDGNVSAGSSSGCSVDDCYDFDKYVRNWCGSPDAAMDKVENPLLRSNVHDALLTSYTDLDELD